MLCQRCTRFSEEIAGDPFIDLLERGADQQIGVAQDKPFQSYFSGNTIQICPVGALTSAAYRFRSRPFDLVSTPGVCEHCSVGAALRIDTRRGTVHAPARRQRPRGQRGVDLTTRAGSRSATSSSQGRITRPMVRGARRRARRDVLDRGAARRGRRACWRPASSGIGVLAGGRLTVEDAYAYAQVRPGRRRHQRRRLPGPPALGRGAGLPGRARGRAAARRRSSYTRLEAAPAVLCVALEPEEEAPIVFLRLRKAARKHRPAGLPPRPVDARRRSSAPRSRPVPPPRPPRTT